MTILGLTWRTTYRLSPIGVKPGFSFHPHVTLFNQTEEHVLPAGLLSRGDIEFVPPFLNQVVAIFSFPVLSGVAA